MSRPLRLPLWARTLVNRTEPIAGTEESGWSIGEPPLAHHINWNHGVAGDWIDYLQRRALDSTEWIFDTGTANRVSTTALTFTIGGPLAQRPTVGGVYRIRKERCDATVVTAPDCPVYNFAATDTNYVWMRPRLDNSRSAYPDVLVTQSLVSPGPAYVLVWEGETDAATLISQTEYSTVRVYHDTGNSLPARVNTDSFTIFPRVGSGSTALEIQTRQSFAPGVSINSEAGQTNTLLQINPQAGQECQRGSAVSADAGMPWEDDIAVYHATLGDGTRGFRATSSETDAAGFIADMGDESWVLAVVPATVTQVSPSTGPNDSRWRLYISSEASVAGGVRWVDAAGADREWKPWASPGGMYIAEQISADSGAIGSGGGTAIATFSLLTLIQNHTYEICVQSEANATVNWVGTVAVTITVGGVTDAKWNARQLRPDPVALNRPWLHATLLYTHAGADTTTGQIIVSVAHGVSAGASVNYIAPRVSIKGAWL